MKPFARFIMVLLLFVTTPLAFAAGDYIWEEKYQRALPKAEQGDIKSQYAVGEMYEKGRGAVKNTVKAFAWYSKAAARGDKKSAYKVGLAYLKGKGVKRNYKNAYKWLKKSAEKNYVRAQYYLGEVYENGLGVPQDLSLAMTWYKRALGGGYGTASGSIKRVARAQENASRKRQRELAIKIQPVVKPKIVVKPKPVIKPKVVAKPKPVVKPKEPKLVAKTAQQMILAGGWKKGSRASEFLPSAITACRAKGVRLTCVSKSIKSNIGIAEITHSTKTSLFDFDNSGKSFKATYRNNVLSVDAANKALREKIPVTLGWQKMEHQLDCVIENERSVICTKDKSRKITLRR
ncbi:MAG: hypothetical protein GXP17_03775 [Gammaproteobacteria bacterium]|nr:hypothetical protein [Gammaproteobacteria bacterium]